MVNLTERDSVMFGHHEEFSNRVDAFEFQFVHEGVFLCDEVLHKFGEAEPGFVVGVAIGLEEEWVALEEAGDFAAAREAQFAVELAGVIEEKDVLRLGGEKLFRARYEAEEGVAVENALQ